MRRGHHGWHPSGPLVLTRVARWWLAILAMCPRAADCRGCTRRGAVRAVGMVMSGRFRQHWKSWLALSVLVAVAGGFVMAATAAARRTDAAFPGFVARHGYDFVVYSPHPLPQLAGLQGVESVTPVLAPFSDHASCGSCSKPIDTSNFLVNEVPAKQLPRMIKLLSGRLPDESRPGEVLASRTLATENGVRIGSVIRVPLYRAT